MGIVSKPIDSALGQKRITEKGNPFFHSAIAGDDGRSPFVPFHQHFIDVARLFVIQALEAEVVDNQQVDGSKFSHHPVGAVVGAGLQQLAEQFIGSRKQDLASGPAGAVSKGTGQKSFANADWPHEEDVFVSFEESQAEQVPYFMSIKGDCCIPIKVFKNLLLREFRLVESVFQAHLFSTINLVLQDQFEKLLV